MKKLMFRAWDKLEKVFMYSNCIGLSQFFKICESGKYIITQYIGKNDKNGKCIYEGDILSREKQYENDIIDFYIVTFGEYFISFESHMYDEEWANDEGKCLGYYAVNDCEKKYVQYNVYNTLFDDDYFVAGNIFENRDKINIVNNVLDILKTS